MKLHTSISALSSACVMGILLVGCGRSANSPDAPPAAGKPDVIVTIDGKRHTCVVALNTEPQGSAIACNDVVSFVKDELRVPRGSIYDLRTIPDVDPAELAKVGASLNGAGYRAIGGKTP